MFCIPLFILPRALGGPQQRAVLQLESGLPVHERGTKAPHKILVGKGRVELHEGYTIPRPREVVRKFCRDVGLPVPGGPLEDDLLLVVEQTFDVLKEGDGEVEFVCEVV